MQQCYWYNGQFSQSSQIQLSIDNPGLLFGATVFTTLRVYENNLDHYLTSWQLHVERIKNSLNFFGWQQPDWQRIRQGAELIKQYFPVLRITIFPDGCELITGRNLPANLKQMQDNGIIATIVEEGLYRSLPAHKTGNYLAGWLAKNRANNSPEACQEAIFTDAAGNWLETTTGNLWGWGDGCWWTPPLTEENLLENQLLENQSTGNQLTGNQLTGKILPGIARSHLLNYLKSQNPKSPNPIVREEPWTPAIISKLETLAYSNSVVEIIPIHTTIILNQRLQYNPHHASLDYLRRFFTTSQYWASENTLK